MRMRSSILPLVIGALTIGGCNFATMPRMIEDVVARTDRLRYAVSEEVLVVVTNHRAEGVDFSACGLRLEQRVGRTWRAVEYRAAACADRAWRIEPASAFRLSIPLPDLTPSGTVRFAFPRVRLLGSEPGLQGVLFSNEFSVERPVQGESESGHFFRLSTGDLTPH